MLKTGAAVNEPLVLVLPVTPICTTKKTAVPSPMVRLLVPLRLPVNRFTRAATTGAVSVTPPPELSTVSERITENVPVPPSVWGAAP